MSKRIRIGIFGDNQHEREQLQSSLQCHNMIDCAFSLRRWDSSVEPVDIAVLDCWGPSLRHIAVSIKALYPTVKLVGFNAAPSQFDYIMCVEIGISGFIVSNSSPYDIVSTIINIGAGQIVIPEN